MEAAKVLLKLNTIHSNDEDDGAGDAEPFLWTAFFKIDGDTVFLNEQAKLQGKATVVGSPGDHGNLLNVDVDAGDSVAIPNAIGQFETLLRPIPLQGLVQTGVPGTIGCVAVLLEEDNTSSSAIAQGHQAFTNAVRDGINQLIPQLGFGKTEPTEEDIQAIRNKVKTAVIDAIRNSTSLWSWLSGFGDMDDLIGSRVVTLSQKELLQAGAAGIALHERWQNEGDWEIFGNASATQVILNEQSDWRWCHKCEGLWFGGGASMGVCPAGGTHSKSGSGNYTLTVNTPDAPGQSNWRWCNKCQVLHFAGNLQTGKCKAGGTHSTAGSGNYVLVHDAPLALGQPHWRWCKQCQALWFSGHPSHGACPAGGAHVSGSSNYVVALQP